MKRHESEFTKAFGELLTMKLERYLEESGAASLSWPKLSAFVLLRDDFTCAYCGRKDAKMVADHVIPSSKGGGDEFSNLVCACENCNRSKSNMTIDNWVEKLSAQGMGA